MKRDPAQTNLLPCVGGLANGERRKIEDSAAELHVPKQSQVSGGYFSGNSNDFGSLPPIMVDIAVYCRQWFHAEGVALCVLVPLGQAPLDTLRLLVANYGRPPTS